MSTGLESARPYDVLDPLRTRRTERGESSMKRFLKAIPAVLVITALHGVVRADVVTDWNRIMAQTVLVAKTSPLVTTRVTAIVQASVFDAVNGIERRYT